MTPIQLAYLLCCVLPGPFSPGAIRTGSYCQRYTRPLGSFNSILANGDNKTVVLEAVPDRCRIFDTYGGGESCFYMAACDYGATEWLARRFKWEAEKSAHLKTTFLRGDGTPFALYCDMDWPHGTAEMVNMQSGSIGHIRIPADTDDSDD